MRIDHRNGPQTHSVGSHKERKFCVSNRDFLYSLSKQSLFGRFESQLAVYQQRLPLTVTFGMQYLSSFPAKHKRTPEKTVSKLVFNVNLTIL